MRMKLFDVLIALGFAVIFTDVEVIASLHQGILSAPPTYDDIVYFVDGAKRLQVLYDNGIWASAQTFIADPPHAPLSTLVSMAAFALFGIHAWAVPVFNGIWIFIILLGLRLCLKDQPLAVYCACAAALLAWPLTAFLLMLGQPDVVCGFLTAIGCLYILSSTWIGSSRRRILIAAMLAASSLLAKPSVSPLTAFLFGSAALLASAADYAARPNKQFSYRDFIGTNFLSASATIVLALPYYAFGWRSVVNYILYDLFSENRSLWFLKLTPVQHAAYYLSGVGGETMMGPWLVITILLLVTAAILQWKWIANHRARVAAIAAWAFVAYLAVAIPAMKSVFLGVVVSCTIFLFCIAALAAIFAKIWEFESENTGLISVALKYCLSAALLVAAILTFHWHVYYRDAGNHAESAGNHYELENATVSARRFALIDQLLDQIIQPPQSSIIYVPAITGYINGSVLQFFILQRRLRDASVIEFLRGQDLLFDNEIVDQLAVLASATDVILLDPDDPEIATIPSTSILRDITEKAASDPDLQLKAVFETADNLHHVTLYERRPPFEGVRAVSGFLPTEGPYPQWNLPYIRWANAEVAQLEPTSNKHDLLYLKGQSSVADQSITVKVDEQSIGICRLPVAWLTVECAMAMPQNLVPKKITLQFSRRGPESVQGHSAFFQKIQLE
jgi:hypothetical protein